MVIAPQTTPAVTPPLGWTLSEMSRAAMDAALQQEAKTNAIDPGCADPADVAAEAQCAQDDKCSKADVCSEVKKWSRLKDLTDRFPG